MDTRTVPYDNYKYMCRLCLSSSDYLLSVFDENYIFLPQRIAACVNVEVHKTDKLPKNICKECLTKVEHWYEFKRCCEDSQSKLRHWTNYNYFNSNVQLIDIKEEIASDNDEAVPVSESTSVIIKSEIHDDENEANSDFQSTSVFSESLLVPSSECPAVVHGMDAPMYQQSQNSISCRVCFKTFSNIANRIRHERSQHLKVEISTDTGPEPEILSIQSISSETEIVPLQEVQENPPTIMSEKHFIEFNRIMHYMYKKCVCNHCNSKYSDIKSLQNHLARLIKVDRFNCFSCCIAFPNRSQYMRHISITRKVCQERSELVGNLSVKVYEHYQCSVCQELHVLKSQLRKHLLRDHYASGPLEACFECKQEFVDENEFEEHLKTSCFYKMYCSICKKSFETNEDYKEHVNIHDDDGTEFDFSKCLINENSSRKRQPKAEELNTYSCGQCGTLFPTLDLWCSHQETHSNIYRCSECNRVFGTEEELSQHKNSHSNIKLKLLRCSTTNSYKAISDFTDEMKKSFQCNICRQKFFSFHALRSHRRVHIKTKPSSRLAQSSLSCLKCKKTFNAKTTYYKHKRSCEMKFIKINGNYDNSFSYTCDVCNKSFLTRKGRNVHVHRMHTMWENASEKNQCEICNKSFLNTEELLEHIKSHSTRTSSRLLQSEKVPCKYCKKTFLNNAGLSSHLKTHEISTTATLPQIKVEPPDNFQCNFCSMEFETRAELTRHIKIHLNGATIAYKCTSCPKVCANNNALIQHVKYRHSLKPPKKSTIKRKICKKPFLNNIHLPKQTLKKIKGHQCEKCSKYLPSSMALMRHIKNNCLYCTSCNKSFTSPKQFNLHKELHNFRCKECSIEFSTHSEYKSHLNEFHKKHECKYCLKTFLYPKTLIKHYKMYHETEENNKTLQNALSPKTNMVRLYKCRECNTNFSNAKALRLHVQSHPDNST